MDPSSEYEQSSFLDELPAPESRESRRVVLNTLSSACEVLSSDLREEGSDFAKINEKIAERKQVVHDFEYLSAQIETARNESLDKGRDTRSVAFEVPFQGMVEQEEGVPVDGLINYLRAKASLAPRNSAERSRYYRYARILHRNSMPYSSFQFTNRDQSNYVGRVMLETDFLAESGQSADIIAARDSIIARRELVLPPEWATTQRSSSTSTEIDVPPEAADETEVIAPLPDPEVGIGEETPDGEEASSEEPEEPSPAPPAEGELESTEEPPEPEAAPPEVSDDEGEESEGHEETSGEEHVEEETEDEEIEIVRDEIRKIRVDIFNAQALVEKTVREWADAQQRKEQFALEGGKGLRSKLKSYLNPVRMFRGLKLHTAEEYYRLKRADVAMSALRESGKLMIENLDAEEIGRALAGFDVQQSEIQALAQQLDTAVLNGQEVRELSDDSALKQLMTDEIFAPVVNGEVSDHAALQQKLREFVTTHADNEDVRSLFGEGAGHQLASLSEFYATNLLEQAESIRENLDAHGFGVDSLDKVIDVRLADIDWLAESEARFTKADRTMAWLQKGRVRSFFAHPAVVGGMFAIGTHGALKVAGVGGRAASLAVPVVGSLSGATFAGLRRSYEIKKDRNLHQVDMAYQSGVAEEGGRRADLEEFAFDISSVQELLDGSDRDDYPLSLPEGILQLAHENLEGLEGAVNRQRLLQKITEITTRLDYSGKNSLDLVSYEGRTKVARGKLVLLRSCVDAERALLAAGMSEDEIAEQSAEYRTRWESHFLADQEDQERKFRRYRVVQSAKAGVVGGVTGFAGAFASQHVLSLAGSVMPEVPGASLVGSLLGRGKEGIEQGLSAAGQKASDVPGGGVAGSVLERGKTEVGRGLSATGKVVSRAPGAPLVGSVIESGKSAFEKVPSVNNIPGTVGERVREQTKEVVTGTRQIPAERPRFGKEGGSGRVSTENFKLLYENGGSLPVGDEYRLVAGDDHSVFLENVASGDRFEDFSLTVTEDGHISGEGSLPTPVKEQFEELGFEVGETIEKTTQPYTVFEPNSPTYEASIRPDGSGPIVKIPEGTVWIEGKDGASTLIARDRPDIVLIPDAKIGEDGKMIWDTEYSYGKHLEERIAAGERDLIDKEDYDLRIGARKEGLFEQLEIRYDETEGTTSVEIKDVFGEEGVWRENATHIDERQWYSYDAEGSQSNELQLYTYKDGDTVTLDMSTMGTAHQQGLEPNPIHVQDLVGNRDERIGFTFVLPNDQKNPIFVVDGADGVWDGKLRLDPNADPSLLINPNDSNSMRLRDLSRLVINQEALQKLDDGNIATELTGNEEVFAVCHGSPGFVEAGRMAQQEGKDVFQAFATIRGKTEIADKVEITTVVDGSRVAEVNFNAPLVENIPSEKQLFELTPPDAPEVIEAEPVTVPVTEAVTEKVIEEPPPMIPFPFVPRYPLEQQAAREENPVPEDVPEYFLGYPPEYGLGYAASGKDSVKDYMNWLKAVGYYPAEKPYVRDSEGNITRVDGSEITRTVSEERQHIEDYLTRQNPEHKRMVQEFAKSLPPMNEDCRLTITMPAYLEEKNIYKTLTEWMNQVDENGKSVDKNLYEVAIIVNGPAGYEKDGTLAEIERFQKDYPDMNVHAIDVEIPQEGGNVGLARKMISDVTLQRSLNRSTQKEPLYIESEDADLMEIDRQAVSRVINQFDSKPYLDALRGKQDLTPTILMENDLLFFDRRVERIIEYLMRDYRLRPDKNENYDFYWNRNITGGWNTAFTADAYALIGGYQPARVGEDVDIGRRISVMRGSEGDEGTFVPNVYTIGNVANKGQSNPRRFIHALLRKVPAYSDFTDEKTNQNIRNMTLQEMMSQLDYGSRISEENVSEFERILTNARHFISWKVADQNMQELLFNRLMSSLGFKKHKHKSASDGTTAVVSGSLHQEGSDKDEWMNDWEIISDGTVKINNIENIKEAFNQYRLNHTTHSAIR